MRRSSLAPFEESGGEQEEHDGEEDRHAELADAVAPELAVRDGEEREEAEQEERERRPGAGLGERKAISSAGKARISSRVHVSSTMAAASLPTAGT